MITKFRAPLSHLAIRLLSRLSGRPGMADFLGRLFPKGLFSLWSAFPGFHLFLGRCVGQRRTLNLFSLLRPDPSPPTPSLCLSLPWPAPLTPSSFPFTRVCQKAVRLGIHIHLIPSPPFPVLGSTLSPIGWGCVLHSVPTVANRLVIQASHTSHTLRA